MLGDFICWKRRIDGVPIGSDETVDAGEGGRRESMTKFLIVFLFVYTGMNAVFFMKARILLPENRSVHVLAGLFLGIMIVAPMVTRLLERTGYEFPARVAAGIGYTWMGFITLAFSATVLLLCGEFLFYLIRWVSGVRLPSLSGPVPAAAVLGLAVLAAVYGLFEARNIRVERVVIATTKLPPGLDRLRIAQISDVHLGLMAGEGRFRPVIDKILAENPDVVVCTGDLLDGNIGELGKLSALFRNLHPPCGMYAVTGNHEAYVGADNAIDITRRFGFRVIRGETVRIAEGITIVGEDDPAVTPRTDEAALLASAPTGDFKLFLKHRPVVEKTSLGLFDLQLSGHSHRGQIFPFNFVTGRFYPMQDGLYQLEKGSRLYTSRGTGTWGPPMRVLAPPEIAIIDLVRE